MTRQPEDYISLGASELSISRLGIGTWAWGDKFFWGYGRGDYNDDDLRAAFDETLAANINWFDTAEIYGLGRSERFLGQFMKSTDMPVLIATKFMPFPWRLWRGCLIKALCKSLKRLGIERVDLYQIHLPLPPISIETWMAALADAIEAGLTRTVGVSNYNLEQMCRAHVALAKRGIPLVSNQVDYSLLQRQPERTGLLEACRELGVTLIAYSPLAQGLLTGKYTPETPPPGVRRRRYSRERLVKIQPLIGLLREIGQAYRGKTPAQVALNWTISKGAVPIPGAKNAQQVRDNGGALGWRLTDEEVKALDEASDWSTPIS
jgi:aryl-alcohol dehydrogenase-like predicted oxidoreductase